MRETKSKLDVPTFSADAAVRGYLPLMHELATRIELTAIACDGKLNLTPPYAREYAYLQFRRICELIALGCLQLHGDLPQASTKSVKKEWHADKIMHILHRDHPYSFPQSVAREKVGDTRNITANCKPLALTRAEFRELYSECGEVLHRGTIRTLEQEKALTDKDYERVTYWQQKIINLMNEHLIGRANQRSFYIISLRTETRYPECSVFNIRESGAIDVSIHRLSDYLGITTVGSK